MQKVRVTAYYDQSIEKVFAAISDHRKFLTGGGLTCHIIKQGTPHKNGLGAVRSVRSKKYTFFETITSFNENESYDYLITEVKPKIPMEHYNGWLEFKEENGQTKVVWQSHFTITTPVIGRLIGWMAKRQLKKVFLKRLNYLKKNI